MSKAREERKEIIRTIVRTSSVRTQEEIIEKLKPFGIEVKQAAVSRDVCDLGLKKDKHGVYVLPQQYNKHLSDNCFRSFIAMSNSVVQQAFNQVVLHTNAGAASTIAVFVDSEFRDEILGSIAGDDTVLIICESEEKAQAICKKINDLLE